MSDDLIQIRMKLAGGRAVVEGLGATTKATKELEGATGRAAYTSERASKKQLSLGRAVSSMGTQAKIALGFLGVGGVFAIESAIHATEELGKTTAGLTRNFDFATNVASRWGAVAFARGIDSKALSMTFGTLSTKLTTAAREGGKALLPFHQLGLTQEDAAKGAHNFQWGLLKVADALGDEEGGAKRAAAAKALLGKGYSTLLPLFSEGAAGLKEQLKWADEYGVTLSGKTNDAIMEMVTSQRELKVAQLGLQVSMTKALMPAIKAGEDQVKEFIKTLNDPHLSADQKIAAIQKQFEGLETDLIRVIERALPGIAEHAGELGLKMAGAVWHGFTHSDLKGKLLISAWLFKAMGGGSLISAEASRIGTMIGTKVGSKIAAGIVLGLVGYEIWEHLSKQTKAEVILWAEGAAIDFVNYFIRTYNEYSPLSWLGLDVDEVERAHHALTPAEAFAPPVGSGAHVGKGATREAAGRSVAEKRKSYKNLWGVAPPPGPPPWPPPSSKRSGLTRSLGTPELPRLNLGALGGTQPGRRRPLHVHLHLKGKQVAEAVIDEAEDAAALG